MTEETKTIQVRRDTAANWNTNNPIPKAGEWCFETDTGITKIGDGATRYNNLVPFRQTTATKTELDKLHGLLTTSTELGYVHGVTSAIQTQLDSKFAKADIQASFGETLSDEKVASEKLVKNSLDTKQDNITVVNNNMLKASVLSAMTIVGENNSGRRYDEPKTLAKMISAAHSTFDRSKFTIVGSPNITDNGIASRFSSGNSINTNYSFNPGNKRWKIKIQFTTTDDLITSQQAFIVASPNGSSSCMRLYANNLRLVIGTTNWGTDISNNSGTAVAQANTDYNIEIEFTGTQYIYTVNGVVAKTVDDSTPIFNIDNNIIYLGNMRGVSDFSSGTMDLKQFSVEVEGKEVFSGNKTGIDTIKNNFEFIGKIFKWSYTDSGEVEHVIYTNSPTSVLASNNTGGILETLYNADGTLYTGSAFSIVSHVPYYGENACTYQNDYITFDTSSPQLPTVLGNGITNDGIFRSSNTYNQNYVKLTGFPTNDKDLTIEFEFSIESENSYDWGTYAFNEVESPDGGAFINRWGWSSMHSGQNFGGMDYFAVGHSYHVILEYKADLTTKLSIKKDTATSYITTDGTYTTLPTVFIFGYRPSHDYATYKSCYVFDLNKIKIYSGGELTYQPLLNVPYTLAANDKKFISPIYEDRAKDMADQFGVAPYYIFDEDNGNFAFPYGSVEEKVAPKIVVGHYEDGASAWEQYLDRTMIQRGTMVADTEVTFPCSDEFANTDFTLSCPFSAKTTTGFTPSASGTYIAIGKF